jgi:2-polyprenyl-6-methoxyphenol hydroxylase-like FAD-dependent oxidoreductase
VVLGSGPVGLLSALRGRQLGMDVAVYANGFPAPQDPPRVECVPAQVVALLVEFGVSPKRVGVDALFRQRTMQWAGGAVAASPTPDAAHIERPALEIALLESALRAGAKIDLLQGNLVQEFRRQHREGECMLLDASGRSAVTAMQRIGPRRPLVARLFHLPTRPSLRGSGLMIAAGPEGYAYRLANAATLTLGVVGRKDFVQGDAAQIVAKIAEFAPWLVEDIRSAHMQSGPSGAASAQWSVGDNSESVLVGDASFAHDALASQGLAMGLSGALKTFVQQNKSVRALPRSDEKKQISVHCQRIVQQIKRSAFGSARPWVEYLEFLSDLVELMTSSGTASRPNHNPCSRPTAKR